MKSFKITEREGIAYSKKSGDNNEIHLNDLAGYNSIFGEKICHGTFVLEKIFKIINLSKILNNQNNLKIKAHFYHQTNYNKKIIIKKSKKNFFEIFQDNKKIIELLILKKFKKENKKIFNPDRTKTFKNKYFPKNYEKNLYFVLSVLSKYVGKFYPGKYSIIKEIELDFNCSKLIEKKKIYIRSKRFKKKFPLIDNHLISKNITINFLSLIRPKYKNDVTKLNRTLINKVKKIKYNALIVGGSQGIGRKIYEILKNNKKIIKIITYNKNLISSNNNKTYLIKLNILKNNFKLDYYIKKFAPLRIFYFASPKILFDEKLSKEKFKELKLFFLDFPEKILSRVLTHKLSFFYPSTLNIDQDKFSDYSKIKLQAEQKLSKICAKNKIIFKTLRLPAINSRQSVSLLNPNPISLNKYLNSNYKSFKKIFL